MYDGRTLHGREVFARVVEAFGDTVFDTVITRTVRFPETTVAGEPITSWAPTSTGAKAYRDLAREVIAALMTDVAADGRGRRRDRRAGRRAADRGARRRRVPRPAGQLRGPVRPAAQPDQPAAARRHRGRAVAGHRRVHQLPRRRWTTWDLGKATEFLVVAATLLDLKTARLLPAAEVEDEEDLALLEARDLLFARLLQYRAYKLAAAYLGELERTQARRYGRAVELEPRFAELLPEVLHRRRARSSSPRSPRAALAPKPVPVVDDRPRARAAGERARAHGDPARAAAPARRGDVPRSGQPTARRPSRWSPASSACSSSTATASVAFDQAAALAELRVRWTGGRRRRRRRDADDERRRGVRVSDAPSETGDRRAATSTPSDARRPRSTTSSRRT